MWRGSRTDALHLVVGVGAAQGRQQGENHGLLPLYTAVAHEVERWTYNPQVDGSIPSGSTNSPWTPRPGGWT